MQINRFHHVICLPFAIRAKKFSRRVHLDGVHREVQAHGAWRPGPAPDLPLTGKTDHESSAWHQFHQHQAWAYFHPAVRRFLYDDNRARRLHRTDIAQVDIRLGPKFAPEAPRTLTLTVARCELWLFEPDVGVLLLEVTSTKPVELGEFQDLLDQFRRLYPPYITGFAFDENDQTMGWKGGHCPAHVRLLTADGSELAKGVFTLEGDAQEAQRAFTEPFTSLDPRHGLTQDANSHRLPLAQHWCALLAGFGTADSDADGFHAHILGDDRAPIMTWIACDTPKNINRGQWMRLCFADASGTDPLPYARPFSQQFEANHCYDRYWYDGEQAVAGQAQVVDSKDSPSRILISGYAFTYVGSAQDEWFFCNETEGAHAIFRHLHVPMGVIAHVQKAMLLSGQWRLAHLIDRSSKGQIRLPDPGEVRQFHDHFIEFNQTSWFHEVSPQEQAGEVFELWRRHLGTEKLHAEFRQALTDLIQRTEMKASSRLNRIATSFGAVSLLLAALALLVSVVGLAGVHPLPTFVPLSAWPAAWLGPLPQVALVAGVASVPLVIYFVWLSGVRDIFRSRQRP